MLKVKKIGDTLGLNRIQPLHVLQVAGDPAGGIRKHIHSIIEGLDENQFSCSYAYSAKSADSRFLSEIKFLRMRLQSELQLQVEKKPHVSDIINLWKLIRFVKINKVNVVHGHGAKGGLYARLVGMICRIPTLYTPHGGVAHQMFSFWQDKLYVFVERCMVRFTNCFIFESNYTAASFLAKVGAIDRPWLVNHNGIHCPSINFDNRMPVYTLSGEVNIGVFGMLRHEKGQIHLINAISSIIRLKNENIRLHIFGSGPDRDHLIDKAKELEIAKNVIFYGDVANSEEEMQKMDIIAIPSLFESFGYVGLEAMALGKPVIASSVGGLKEIFTDETALLVMPGDELGLSQAIIRFMETPELSYAMAQKVYESCKLKFSLERMIKTLSKQYLNFNSN